jgi:hypothetical protein
VLGEQPAERGDAGRAVGEAIGARGKRLAQPREAPWRQRVDLGDGGDDFEGVAVAGEDGELERGLALEAQRVEQRPARRGLALAPFGEARFVDRWTTCAGSPRSARSREAKSVIARP